MDWAAVEFFILFFDWQLLSFDSINFIIHYFFCRYRLSFGCNDKLQLGSLIATFTRARAALVAAAK